MVLSALSYRSSTVHLVYSSTTTRVRPIRLVSCSTQHVLSLTVVLGSTSSLTRKILCSCVSTVVVSCRQLSCCVHSAIRRRRSSKPSLILLAGHSQQTRFRWT